MGVVRRTNVNDIELVFFEQLAVVSVDVFNLELSSYGLDSFLVDVADAYKLHVLQLLVLWYVVVSGNPAGSHHRRFQFHSVTLLLLLQFSLP